MAKKQSGSGKTVAPAPGRDGDWEARCELSISTLSASARLMTLWVGVETTAALFRHMSDDMAAWPGYDPSARARIEEHLARRAAKGPPRKRAARKKA